MSNPDFGRIHEIKKKLRILASELDKMQSDPESEAEHFEQAYFISQWVNQEMNDLFPTINSVDKINFEFQSGVLIDDYPLYADTWNSAGLKYGRYVTHYLDEKSFLSDLDKIDRSTFIYIDWYLDQFKNSYDLVKYLGNDLGENRFQNIIITTDEIGLELSAMPWVKAIIGKDPPWSLGTTSLIRGIES
jgi:hypothetical protein